MESDFEVSGQEKEKTNTEWSLLSYNRLAPMTVDDPVTARSRFSCFRLKTWQEWNGFGSKIVFCFLEMDTRAH